MSRTYSESMGGDRDTADSLQNKRQKTFDDNDEDEGPNPFGKPLVLEQFGEDDQVAVKMRGLDFKATFDEVYEFF